MLPQPRSNHDRTTIQLGGHLVLTLFSSIIPVIFSAIATWWVWTCNHSMATRTPPLNELNNASASVGARASGRMLVQAAVWVVT